MRKFLKKEKVCIVLSIMVAFLLVIAMQMLTIDYKIENAAEIEGTGQFFYQSRPKQEISEERQLTTGFSEIGLKFELAHKMFLGDVMRLDLDTDEKVSLTGMEVKYDGITIQKITPEELYKMIVSENSVETKLEKGNLSVVKVGEDPNITFAIQIPKLKLLSWFILKLFVFSCVIEGILWCGRSLYKKDKKKFWNSVHILFIVAVVCSILLSDYKLIRNICRTGEQSYYIHESGVFPAEVQNKEIITNFVAVGKVMNSIEAEMSTTGGAEGKIEYAICDENGNVLEQKKTLLSSLLTEDELHIKINVSKLGLVQGKQYQLITKFKECNGIVVNQCGNGLVLRQNFEFVYKTQMIIMVIASSALIMTIFGFIYKYGLKKRLYVVLFIFVGLITVFIIPPASRDDEFRHFLRVYTLAEGKWKIEPSIAQGNEIGNMGAGAGGIDYVVSVPEEVSQIRLLDYEFNYNDTTYFSEVNNSLCIDKLISILKSGDLDGEQRLSIVSTGTRGIVYYWPQVLFVWIGMRFGVRPIILYYLARMGQMLVCAIMGLLSLKLLSEKEKDYVWLFAFVPNVLLLQCSCNCDGLLIAEVLLLVSGALWMRRNCVQVFSGKGMLWLLFWVIMSWQIVKMKVPYIFLCVAVFLLLKKDNFSNVCETLRKYKKHLLIGTMIVVVLIGTYLFVINRGNLLLQMLYKFVSKDHVDYIIENPKTIGKMFGLKWIQQVKELYQSLNGFDVVPYVDVMILSLIACRRELKIWQRICCLLLCVGMVLVMVLIGFTMLPPDAGYIWGITYRYLLPIMPFAMLILPSGTDRTQEMARRLYPAFIMSVLITSCTSWLVWLDKM